MTPEDAQDSLQVGSARGENLMVGQEMGFASDRGSLARCSSWDPGRGAWRAGCSPPRRPTAPPPPLPFTPERVSALLNQNQRPLSLLARFCQTEHVVLLHSSG